MSNQPPKHARDYVLRATTRCLIEDLGFSAGDAEEPVEDLARKNSVLAAFCAKRGQLPGDQDRIRGLKASIVAYSLHAGPDRGLTWYDERNGIVWLLASRFHRSGKRQDSYPFFRALHREDLLPSRDDYRRHFAAQAYTFAKALLIEPEALLLEARQQPDTICEGRIAGRIDVRLVVTIDDTLTLVTVALSQHLRPGEAEVPSDWLVQLAAAFLPDTPFERLMLTDELAGEPLRPDEIAFSDFGNI
jgi:hypothetical protein